MASGLPRRHSGSLACGSRSDTSTVQNAYVQNAWDRLSRSWTPMEFTRLMLIIAAVTGMKAQHVGSSYFTLAGIP